MTVKYMEAKKTGKGMSIECTGKRNTLNTAVLTALGG